MRLESLFIKKLKLKWHLSTKFENIENDLAKRKDKSVHF